MRKLFSVLLSVLVCLQAAQIANAQTGSDDPWPLKGYHGPQIKHCTQPAPAGRGTRAYEPSSFGLRKVMEDYERRTGKLEDIPMEVDGWLELITPGNATTWTWTLTGTMFKGRNGQILFRADCGNPAGRFEPREEPATPAVVTTTPPATVVPVTPAVTPAADPPGAQTAPPPTVVVEKKSPKKGWSKKKKVAVGVGIAAAVVAVVVIVTGGDDKPNPPRQKPGKIRRAAGNPHY